MLAPAHPAASLAQVHIEPGSYHCTKVDGITTAFNTPAGTGHNSDMDSQAWCTRIC